MTKKEIKQVFGFKNRWWENSIASDYKLYFKFVKDVTNTFPYSFRVDLEKSTVKEHVLCVDYQTGDNTSGSAMFVLPVGNAYYSAVLAMLQSGSKLITN